MPARPEVTYQNVPDDQAKNADGKPPDLLPLPAPNHHLGKCVEAQADQAHCQRDLSPGGSRNPLAMAKAPGEGIQPAGRPSKDGSVVDVPPKVFREVGCRGIPLGRLLLQTLQADNLQIGTDAGIQEARWSRFVI